MTNPVMPQKTADVLRTLWAQVEAANRQIQASVETAADLLSLSPEHWTYDIPSGEFRPIAPPAPPADDPTRLG